MAGMVDVRAARELRRLVERVGRLERQIRAQARASQARNRSVEGGAFEVYDEDGVLRSVVGAQGDGSYTIRDRNGPKPQAPGSPDMVPFPGGLLVVWDGTFEGVDPLAAPADFSHVEVHASTTADFTPTDDTQRGTIPNKRGGTAAVSLSHTSEWFVALVTVTTSDKESDKSEVVSGFPLPNEFGFWHDDFTAIAGAQTFELTYKPAPKSEHLYVNGVEYEEADGWSRNTDTTITAAATLDLRANDSVRVEYAKYAGVGTLKTIVPYSTSGWLFKQVAENTGTDFSAINADESGFHLGSTPAGYSTQPTQWDNGTALWMRRELPRSYDVRVTIDVEDNAEIWVNGEVLANFPEAGSGKSTPVTTINVPNRLTDVDGKIVLAILCRDEVPQAGNTHADVKVEGRLK